jgi:uncharacterized membrane protein
MKSMLTAAALAALLALQSHAQEIEAAPALYDVTGVVADDVLNVRERPDAGSPIVGTLRPDAARVEVIGVVPGGRWGLVNVEEMAGWVSMRFMSPSEVAMSEPPVGLTCSGTEPFWSVSFQSGTTWSVDLVYMGIGDAPIAMSGWSAPAINRINGAYGFSGLGGVTRASGIIDPGLCEDGMSLRAFGYGINMMIDGTERMVLNGCCSLGSH